MTIPEYDCALRRQSGPANGAQTMENPESTALKYDGDIRESCLVDDGADIRFSRSCAVAGAAGEGRSRRRRWWTTGETKVLCFGGCAPAEYGALRARRLEC